MFYPDTVNHRLRLCAAVDIIDPIAFCLEFGMELLKSGVSVHDGIGIIVKLACQAKPEIG